MTATRRTSLGLPGLVSRRRDRLHGLRPATRPGISGDGGGQGGGVMQEATAIDRAAWVSAPGERRDAKHSCLTNCSSDRIAGASSQATRGRACQRSALEQRRGR